MFGHECLIDEGEKGQHHAHALGKAGYLCICRVNDLKKPPGGTGALCMPVKAMTGTAAPDRLMNGLLPAPTLGQ